MEAEELDEKLMLHLGQNYLCIEGGGKTGPNDEDENEIDEDSVASGEISALQISKKTLQERHEARVLHLTEKDISLGFRYLPGKGLLLDYGEKLTAVLTEEQRLELQVSKIRCKLADLFVRLLRVGLRVSVNTDPQAVDFDGIIYDVVRIFKGKKTRQISARSLTKPKIKIATRQANPHLKKTYLARPTPQNKKLDKEDEYEGLHIIMAIVRAELFDELVKPEGGKSVIVNPDIDGEKPQLPFENDLKIYILSKLDQYGDGKTLAGIELEIEGVKITVLELIEKAVDYCYFILRSRHSASETVGYMCTTAVTLVLGHDDKKYKGKNPDIVRDMLERRMQKTTRSRRAVLSGIINWLLAKNSPVQEIEINDGQSIGDESVSTEE